ncbi:MAG: Spy/CpxP family protein refolding chaperone [Kiritimatiellae bacterium]|nr:Spy/CpxP family protein refolding chaperone [Kiritimatiellia bacterium]
MKCSIMLVTAMIAAVTFGQDAPKRNMGRFRPMGEGVVADPIARMVSNPRFAEKLNLTEEQKTKLEELNKTQREGMKEKRTKMSEAMKRQMDLMNAEEIDESKVMASIDEVFALRCAMAKDQVKRVIAVKNILTPEQVKKANEIKAEFSERGGRHPEVGERGRPRRNAERRGVRRSAEKVDAPKAESGNDSAK